MKILVYGAGVLGCNLARNLFRAGKDVTLLARGKWAEEIPWNGAANQGQILAPHLSHPHSGSDRTETGGNIQRDFCRPAL